MDLQYYFYPSFDHCAPCIYIVYPDMVHYYLVYSNGDFCGPYDDLLKDEDFSETIKCMTFKDALKIARKYHGYDELHWDD